MKMGQYVYTLIITTCCSIVYMTYNHVYLAHVHVTLAGTYVKLQQNIYKKKTQ